MFLAFCADGKTILSQTQEGPIKVWETATGIEARRIDQKPDNTDSAWAISPDGKTLVGFGDTENPEESYLELLVFWDMATGRQTSRVKTSFFCGTCCISFLPDSRTIALGRDDDNAYVVDMKTGKPIRAFVGHRSIGGEGRRTSAVEAVACCSDGLVLATGATDQTVRLWEVATGKQIRCLEGHQGAVHTVAVSPDGKTVASGSEDQTIRLWSAATGQELHRLGGNQGPVYSVCFSPDGELVAAACADHVVRRWTVRDGKELPSGDGHRDTIFSLAYLKGGRKLMTVGEDLACFIWNLETGKGHLQIPGKPGRALVSAVSPTGALLAVGDDNGGVYLRDVMSGAVRDLSGHADSVLALAFSRDEKTLASTGFDHAIRLWDVATGKQLSQTFWTDPATTSLLCFSPDGNTLGCIGPDNYILVWNITTAKQILRFSLEDRDRAVWLAFSPDGKTLASGSFGGYIDLWEMASGRKRLRFKAREGPIRSLVFSPDSNLLAFMGWEEVVHLWDFAAGEEFQHLTGHQGSVSCLAFSPDGKTLASGSSDTTALVWDLTSLRSHGPVGKTSVTPSDLERPWRDLGSEDAAEAFHALQRMVQVPEQSLALLQKQVQLVHPVDTRQIGRLISQLDDKEFDKRADAERELAKLGELAEAQLRGALSAHPSAEVRRRVERLLPKLEGPKTRPDQLRAIRVVEILEHIGSSEARGFLKTLAQGAPQALQTREAKQAVDRLKRLPPK